MGMDIEVPTRPGLFPVPNRREFLILFPGDSYIHKIDDSFRLFFKSKFNIQGIYVEICKMR